MRSMVLGNWQTTLVGVAVILAASLGMKYGGVDATSGAALIAVGLGFVLSGDGRSKAAEPKKDPPPPPVA